MTARTDWHQGYGGLASRHAVFVRRQPTNPLLQVNKEVNTPKVERERERMIDHKA